MTFGVGRPGILQLESIAQGVAAIDSGIQPNPGFLRAVGAPEHFGDRNTDLVELFRVHCKAASTAELRLEIDSTRIPIWQTLTRSLANVGKN